MSLCFKGGKLINEDKAKKFALHRALKTERGALNVRKSEKCI